MAIDLDAIKSKLKTLQESATKKSDVFWKPPVGKTQIRIVPYQHNKDWPFQELYFHYEVGKKTMVSPSSYGRPDPILEFAEKLKKSGDKDDWKLGRKIEPKFRCYVPILVRGEESEGVKFYAFGKKIYQELLSVINDPDYGDISDMTTGRDITIEHHAPEKDGGFPSYTVRVKPNTSTATDDNDVVEVILNKQVELPNMFTELSYDEMTDALKEWLEPGTGGSETQVETAPIANATTANTTGDVGEAFDKLFNT